MPFIDDILRGMQIQIDAFYYNLLFSLASIHWSILRAFIMMGYAIELFNRWLADKAFVPLIQQTNASLSLVVNVALIVALFVLGITYLLSVFVRLNVVEPRSALLWYLAGALFFSIGPSLFQGMNDIRQGIGQAFYLSALNGLQANAGGAFNSLSSVETDELGLLPLCDNLGTYLPGVTTPQSIDGLDVALTYLRADGIDIMGYHPPFRDLACRPHPPDPATGRYTARALPNEWDWHGSFFDNTQSGQLYELLTDEERQHSLDMASAAQGRLLTSWPLVIFGLCEQLVYLLLTIAQGLTFISFSCAILFAFFKRTEIIARSILELWVELIIQTLVIALIQSLVVAFFLVGTASGNGLVVLGIGLICLVFMLIVLWSGIKAVWNSFNRLFRAFGQASGGVFITPGAAAALTAGAGAAVVGGTLAVGSNALSGVNALVQGATPAQAAGLALGGVQQITSAARTLAYLPGVRNTPLGEAAEQFTEGATTRRVGGSFFGIALLTDRDPAAANYDEQGRVISRPMLIPAVGEALESWTVPIGSPRKRDASDMQAVDDWYEDEDGQFFPIYPQRTGTFTPVALPENLVEHQRSDYAAEMNEEELEQDIADTINSSDSAPNTRLDEAATRLEQAADALGNSTRSQLLSGQLKVSGGENVAGVLGDVIRQAQAERNNMGQPLTGGMDHLAVAAAIAQAMGLNPLQGQMPISENLGRFGLFTDQALRMGLSGEQTENVIREVKTSPDGTLQPDTREALVGQVKQEHNLSWDDARSQVDTLENRARLLPEQIVAVGQMPVPVDVRVQVKPEVTG
jgi:hypothetical protein